MQKKVAIFEIGGSHDECILSQVIALKNAGCSVVFCGTSEMFHRNLKFVEWFDSFHEVQLPKTMFGDFFEIRRLNRWFLENAIDIVIANTAQGGHVRNLCLTAAKRIKFFGIIHTIKMLDGSFTQKVISRKIKNYFVLNDQLKSIIGNKNGLVINSFYPLDFPTFDLVIDKGSNEFWVTIIGGVENRRKDLSGFIQLAKNATTNIKFIFLGKSDRNHPDVKAFIEQIESNELANRVKLFFEFIDQELFDGYLKKTDCILPLIHPGTPSSEEYFTRQIPGAINVAFGYKIPMLIHERYANWQDFSSGVLFYRIENQLNKMDEMAKDSEIYRRQMEADHRFSARYHREKFAQIILS